LAIVVARRSWLEISLWKTEKGRKKEKGARKEGKKERRKEGKKERRKEGKKERREVISKRPSSTAEIR
jgi:hypothetical protein